MQGARAVPRRFRTSQRLAVYRHDFRFAGPIRALRRTRRLRPGRETLRKRLFVDEPKYLAKRLRLRNAMGERQKAAQPFQRRLANRLHALKVVRPAHDAHKRRQQNLAERVSRHPHDPMIRNLPSVIQKSQTHGAALPTPLESI